MAPAIKQKFHNLPGVEYLYEIMSPEQLEIPAYITEYDMTVRGFYLISGCTCGFACGKQIIANATATPATVESSFFDML